MLRLILIFRAASQQKREAIECLPENIKYVRIHMSKRKRGYDFHLNPLKFLVEWDLKDKLI